MFYTLRPSGGVWHCIEREVTIQPRASRGHVLPNMKILLLVLHTSSTSFHRRAFHGLVSLPYTLVGQRRAGLIFISHDLDLVASFCDRVLVMYTGRVMETVRASELYTARHSYTRGPLSCRSRLRSAGVDSLEEFEA